MKSLILSDLAERSFRLIATYSKENFGARRGEDDARTLNARCAALARGELSGRSCREVFAPDLRADLRFVASGSHYIIFRESDSDVLIIDFIHQSADVGGRLGGPHP
jgi:toxin ParE1/3/4